MGAKKPDLEAFIFDWFNENHPDEMARCLAAHKELYPADEDDCLDDYHTPDASGYSRADEEWFFDADGRP